MESGSPPEGVSGFKAWILSFGGFRIWGLQGLGGCQLLQLFMAIIASHQSAPPHNESWTERYSENGTVYKTLLSIRRVGA